VTDCSWHDDEAARARRAGDAARTSAWPALLTVAGMLALLLAVVTLVRPPVSAFAGEDGEALVARLGDEAVEALARGADIHLPRPVEVVLLTREDAYERRKAYAASLEQDRGITAGMDLVADLLFSGNMLGRYLPDEKVVYVIEDVLEDYVDAGAKDAEDTLFGVIAHELVHAYDDMVHEGVPGPTEIKALVGDPRKLLEMNTTMALIEGRATYAAELASEAAGRAPLEAPTLEDVRGREVLEADDTPLGTLAAGLGNSVLRVKLLQYVQGRAFAKAAHEYGGERFFDEVFAHLPLDEAELEDFSRFKVRWASELEERLEAEGEEEEAAADEGPSAP